MKYLTTTVAAMLNMASGVSSTLRGGSHRNEASSPVVSSNPLQQEKNKVTVGVYVEALCPDCKEDFTAQVLPAFELLHEITDFNVVPYGNAQIDLDKKQLDCQHGKGECIANSYMQCAKDIYPYTNRYLPFFRCVFAHATRENVEDPTLYQECSRRAALDFATLQKCRDNKDRVWDLQVQASKETPEDHEYVPWLTVNGKHIDQEHDEKLIDAICEAYNTMKSDRTPYPACPEAQDEVAIMT